MQTRFTDQQLADPKTAHSEQILRKCVHCGFCTATCPTYVLLGDELDSPRGRIYLIKDMLEAGRPASERVVRHIDRCLSCLACMTTCPSGVHYMHLVDHARAHIEKTYRRPLPDRLLRALLAWVLPRPALFGLAIRAARLAAPFKALLPGRLRGLIALAPAGPLAKPRTAPPTATTGARRARMVLLDGCVQQTLAPEINAATARLLTRLGVDVVPAGDAGCCGALTHHLGKEDAALASARRNIDAWWDQVEGAGLDAIVITASGCGTTVKDYGHMLAGDPVYADKAARIAALAKDVTEVVSDLGLAAPTIDTGQRVAYHAACSMQHGQQIVRQPKALLTAAGFDVVDVPEGHLCCGSAGTYNILQPEIARRLRDRKVANIERTRPAMVATGNIGCMVQIGQATELPIVHTVELLDWATGGPRPAALAP